MEGDVYFSIDKSPNYYQLSKRKPEDNRAGERVAFDSRKQNPKDFALWKVEFPFHVPMLIIILLHMIFLYFFPLLLGCKTW